MSKTTNKLSLSYRTHKKEWFRKNNLAIFTHNINNSGISYDVDALALFTTVGDIPIYAKNAWNDRVLAFKANGTWAGLISVLPLLPTQSMTEFLRDGKTLSLTAGMFWIPATEVSPFVTGQVTGGNEGVNFFASTTIAGQGYIKTGIIPSASLTLNNSCIGIGFSRDEAGKAGYSFGSFQSATQSLIFQKRNLSNQCQGDMYGSGAGGRITQTSADGAKGAYILNRKSSTDFKLIKNGTTITSTVSTSGSLPTIEMILNGYNSSGAPSAIRNNPIAFFCVYGSGITDAKAIQECTDWNTFLVSMERSVTFLRNIVLDGNSHTVYWRSKTFRALQFANAGIGLNAKYHNVGVSGQTTATMNTNAVANVDSLYDATVAKNICIIWEVTNDISLGATIATVISNFQTYCTNRRATGYKVIGVSALARDYTGDTTKILNTDLFNVWLRDNWATYMDAYVAPVSTNYWLWRADFASDAAYVTAITALTDNATYYDDGATHLTDFGYKEWGNAIATQILTI